MSSGLSSVSGSYNDYCSVNPDLDCRNASLDCPHRGCTATSGSPVPGWVSDPQTNTVAVQLGSGPTLSTLAPHYPHIHCNPNYDAPASHFGRHVLSFFGAKSLDLSFDHRHTVHTCLSVLCFFPRHSESRAHVPQLHSSKRLVSSCTD